MVWHAVHSETCGCRLVDLAWARFTRLTQIWLEHGPHKVMACGYKRWWLSGLGRLREVTSSSHSSWEVGEC